MKLFEAIVDANRRAGREAQFSSAPARWLFSHTPHNFIA
jgi:hypothetical protein